MKKRIRKLRFEYCHDLFMPDTYYLKRQKFYINRMQENKQKVESSEVTKKAKKSRLFLRPWKWHWVSSNGFNKISGTGKGENLNIWSCVTRDIIGQKASLYYLSPTLIKFVENYAWYHCSWGYNVGSGYS